MEDNKIIYDLVKETRDDVKGLAEKLNAHILLTASQMVEVKAPQTFLKTLSTVVLWLGAMGGFLSTLMTFFFNPKH